MAFAETMTQYICLTYSLGHAASHRRVAIIPFSQNRAFVGRKDVLDRIDAVFSDTEADHRVAIYGLGGIG